MLSSLSLYKNSVRAARSFQSRFSELFIRNNLIVTFLLRPVLALVPGFYYLFFIGTLRGTCSPAQPPKRLVLGLQRRKKGRMISALPGSLRGAFVTINPFKSNQEHISFFPRVLVSTSRTCVLSVLGPKCLRLHIVNQRLQNTVIRLNSLLFLSRFQRGWITQPQNTYGNVFCPHGALKKTLQPYFVGADTRSGQNKSIYRQELSRLP